MRVPSIILKIISKQQKKKTPTLPEERIWHHKGPRVGPHLWDDDNWSPGANMGSEVLDEHFIDCEGSVLLAVDYCLYTPSNSQQYVLVPGFIVGQPKKYGPITHSFKDEDTLVSLVEPITDPTLREDISKNLATYGIDTKGGIVFW